MSLNLETIKTIDVHSHPFPNHERPFTEREFLEQLSLSVLPGLFDEQIQVGSAKMYSGLNMYMQITIRRLAEYFACEPTIKAVVEKRNEQAKNYSEYTQKLFGDVQLEGLVLDYGYPTPRISKNEFERRIGFSTWEVYRIEPVMDQLREENDDFEQFIEAYREDLRKALTKQHVIGLKSIIAYRSGLKIQPVTREQAEKQYDEFKRNHRALVKDLRDYCFYIAMEECTYANKAMHIHTGVGDGEILLDESSPSLLVNLLRDKQFENTIVHLVHGGYPWMEEAAFLCAILPNVYMDISLQNPFTGHGVKRIISEVFEFAPFNKVMFGTDAFTIPEMNWLGVKLFKECLHEVLNEWIERDYMDESQAQGIAELVLYKNFETLYLKD